MKLAQFGRNFMGRTKGRLVYEYKAHSQVFSGSTISNSVNYTGRQASYSDLGTAGSQLSENLSGLTANNDYKWRTRLQYDPVSSLNGQVYGPWKYYNSYSASALGFKAQLTPLPVSLLTFNASLDQAKEDAILRWTTASELNNAFFAVEKSTDLEVFTEIAQVEGAGNSNHLISYSISDDDLQTGTTYYRLRQVDHDGSFSYSRIVCVNLKKEFSIQPLSNPVQEGITKIRISGNAPEDAVIQLLDSDGRLLQQQSVNGRSLIEFEVQHYASGIYFLRLLSAEETNTIKLLLSN